LMRILTRELMSAQRLLGISDSGFMRSMMKVFLEYYPELGGAKEMFLEYLNSEEPRFSRTIQSGLREMDQRMNQHPGRALPSNEILEYEKNHGLPYALLKYLLWQRQVVYDPEAYQQARKRFLMMVKNADRDG